MACKLIYKVGTKHRTRLRPVEFSVLTIAQSAIARVELLSMSQRSGAHNGTVWLVGCLGTVLKIAIQPHAQLR